MNRVINYELCQLGDRCNRFAAVLAKHFGNNKRDGNIPDFTTVKNRIADAVLRLQILAFAHLKAVRANANYLKSHRISYNKNL